MRRLRKAISLAASALALAACGGSSPAPPPPPTEHVVDLSWAANRESGVNRPGGGYRVDITGKPTTDVPYVSGLLAPTSITTTLYTGSYTVTVRAYAALDAQGGTSGTLSAPTQMILNVP